jgi:hypothetical protein
LYQNVSPPHYGGIFDSSVKLKADRKFQPQAYIDIPRLEIFDQRRDWPKWGVLKLARKILQFHIQLPGLRLHEPLDRI